MTTAEVCPAPIRRVMNLAHCLRQAARRFPDEIAIVQGAAMLSWAEFDRRVDGMAAALAARGIGKGDRVLVQSRNCPQMLQSMFACFRLGAVWVPTNFRQTPDEVAYLAHTAGVAAMICQAAFPAHVAAVQACVPDLRTVIAIGGAGFGEDFDMLADTEPAAPVIAADVDHDDPCWFFFTSGTTGRPKAAVLTHGQMGFVITSHLCDLMPGTTHDDASLVVAPLSHGAGIHQLAQIARAVKTVLPEAGRLDPVEIWSLVQRWRITNLFAVPTIVKILTEHEAVDHYDHGSLRYVIYAGAPMYREDQKHAIHTLGPVLVQYFGLGEVTGNITVLPPALHDARDHADSRAGTCGYERTAMQVSIQDEAGCELPASATGEICVCGPAVFARYYNNPEATAKAFRNGWFRTGDLGHLDPQGFLFVTGRSSDMYISGGSNFYPREIEEMMLVHPAIAEVVVVGLEDRRWGEIGVAAVVLKPGTVLTEADLLGWMEGRLARYKLPQRVVFWPELPKSAYGKVTKALVRAGLMAQACAEPSARA